MNPSINPNRARVFVALLGVVIAFVAVIIALALSPESRNQGAVQGQGLTIDARPLSSVEAVADASSTAKVAPAPVTPAAVEDLAEVDLAAVIPEPWEAEPALGAAAPVVTPMDLPKVKPKVQRRGLVEVVDGAIATGVINRIPEGLAEAFTIETEGLWAWVKVNNPGPPTTITMVWRKGEEVGFRIDLNVGQSTGWRTWSRKTVRRYDIGEWSVDVLDADGTLVHTIDFEVVDDPRTDLPT